MHEEFRQFTIWFNHLFGPFGLWLLHALHMPANSERPIPEYVVMSILVLVLGTVLALIVRSRLSVERPGALQQSAEMLITNPLSVGIRDLLEENVGHDWHKYIAFTGSISIFVLLANLLGVFPALASPTSSEYVPLACALLTFIYFNWQGARHHGVGGYLLTFAGSPKTIGDWALAVLLFPVEIISTLARILSLTVRLWANIFASELIYLVFIGLLVAPFEWGWGKSHLLGVVLWIFPALIPLLFIGLHIFVSLIQAYIFTVLPAIYLGLAVADEH
jgi:F-type H+-transporting ATPase subunit a